MPTVRDFDEFLTALDPSARCATSPDGLKWGRLEQEVHSVATTWMASMDVIRKAAERGADLIVAHEPTFWFHGTPENDELAQCERAGIDMTFKTDLLAEHGMAVIRAHNCWDPYPVYGIEACLRERLGLPEPTPLPGAGHHVYDLPETSLSDLARHCRERMGMACVRVSGRLEKTVRRIALAYGAASGAERYYAAWRAGVDAIVTGEQCEWCAIRPAIDMDLGVIELGHSNSEADGMEGLARLLREHFPSVPIEHIPTGDSFSYVMA